MMPAAHVRRCLAVFALALGLAATAAAEVVRVTVTSRTDVDHGYEKIVGRVFFAVDPTAARNTLIADIDKAPRNAAGRVEFSSDLHILRPKTGGAGVALVDIVNRGRVTVLNSFNRSSIAGAELGDGLLMKRGFTVVAVGWEFDAPRRDGAIRLEVPAAIENGRAVTPLVSGQFTPEKPDRSFTVNDLAGYTPAEGAIADAVLTVRTAVLAEAQDVPRASWTLSGNTVTTTGAPFEPGRIYELTYRATSAPVSGLGLAAVRDERLARKDPRRSIAERYPSRERYLSELRQAAAARVAEGYLLADDVETIVRRAAEHWDLLMGSALTLSAGDPPRRCYFLVCT
jgi:hypothetical protein